MLKSNEFFVPDNAVPDRADRLLCSVFSGQPTRSSIARLIRLGAVLVNGTVIRPRTIIRAGDRVQFVNRQADLSVTVQCPKILEHHVIFEDSHLIVLNKPPGLVVHPGAGRPSGTLVDGLIQVRPEMVGVGQDGRWGVVHRLDRDTSGVMVLAKTALAYENLSRQFREHTVHRRYLAVVRGNPGTDHGIVVAPLGRHGTDRKRISTSAAKTRHAVTRWTVNRRFGIVTLLEVKPETGRTHQIRVHLASVGLPVLGDPVYGRIRKPGRSSDPVLKEFLTIMKRQALHAAVLGFNHPENSQYIEFSSAIPADMAEVIDLASEYCTECQ